MAHTYVGAKEVFEIAELVEMILLLLPPASVLILQRLSPSIRDAIQNSAKHQRALFILEDPSIKKAKLIRNPDAGTVIPIFDPESWQAALDRDEFSIGFRYIFNPLILKPPSLQANLPGNLALHDIFNNSDIYALEFCSCAEMFISMPAVTTTWVSIKWEGKGWDHSETETVQDREGIRFGSVLLALHALRQQHPSWEVERYSVGHFTGGDGRFISEEMSEMTEGGLSQE